VLIAIDGPAGAGKSTVARALARELRFCYLDSGAMYRCVGLLSLRAPMRPPGELAREANIELAGSRAGSARGRPGETSAGDRVLLDGRDVTDAIRAGEVSDAASRVAADPEVRRALVARQRELVARGDWVAEGRDIATVVVPDADLKVFLTAGCDERARRRARELGSDAAAVLAEQRRRDQRDRARAHGPLAAAPDAVVIDTTGVDARLIVRRLAELALGASASG
jgi:cytidylate kinase